MSNEAINNCLFEGVNDIKTHRWFGEIDWEALFHKKLPPTYKPTVR